jgi:hypothetical protein
VEFLDQKAALLVDQLEESSNQKDSWLVITKYVLLVVKFTYQKVVKLVVESFNQKSGLSVVEFIY